MNTFCYASKLFSSSKISQIRNLKKSVYQFKHIIGRGNINAQTWRSFKLHPKNCEKWKEFFCGKLKGNFVHSGASFTKFIFGISVAIGGKLLLLNVCALCDAQDPSHIHFEHDRLEGIEDVDSLKEPPFEWVQFWQLLKPQIYHFLGAVISALIVALCNIQIPSLLGEVINVVSAASEGESAPSISAVSDQLLGPSLEIFKVYVIQSAFTFIYIAFLTRMGERMAADLREDLFHSYLRQDIAFYDKHKAGELVNRLTADVQDFKSSFKMCVSQGIRSIAQMIGCGVSMYRLSPRMAALAALVVPTVIVIGTALGSLLRSLSRAAQQQVGLSTAVADECLGNMRTVRAFAMEDGEARLFAREVEKSRRLNELLGTGIGIFQAGANLFLNGIVLGTLYMGGRMVRSHELEPGQLMAFLVSAQTIQKSLGQLTIMWGTFVRGASAGARVFEYINEEPGIPMKDGKRIPYHSLMGNIDFKNVSFAYPTRPDQMVLSDFNLKVPAGRVLAIVGASGGGKSTVAQLLERFYDICEGSITVDGVDIRTLDPSWLRGKLIGFINQEPVLFATSVMENIRYGRPGATDQEVIEAARTANAHEFICQFPAGYDTVVGERGVSVSGGQKQRIAIARALLKNPSILVLDEATSALDAESELVVQKALEQCVAGRTTIIIAHRLSTIQKADVIAVIAGGRVVELGDHETLKRLGGIYAELIRQQQRESNAHSSHHLRSIL